MIHEFEVKIALENYQEYIDALKDANDNIEVLQTRIDHAGGSVAKRPENPMDSDSRKLMNIDAMDKLVAIRDRYQHNVRLVEHFIGWCKDTKDHRDKRFIIDRYVYQRSIVWLSCEYFMDRSMVFRRTDYLIRKYIESLKVATNRIE